MPEIKLIKIDHLELLENNPRSINKSQFKKLCDSIDEDPEFFSNRPCLVNDDGKTLTVYAGNQRVQAARKLGWKMVPCIIGNNISPDVMKKRIIKDNAHHGEFDWDILSADYDIPELLDCGLTESDLQLNLEDQPTNRKQKKKVTQCPNCAHIFE